MNELAFTQTLHKASHNVFTWIIAYSLKSLIYPNLSFCALFTNPVFLFCILLSLCVYIVFICKTVVCWSVGSWGWGSQSFLYCLPDKKESIVYVVKVQRLLSKWEQEQFTILELTSLFIELEKTYDIDILWWRLRLVLKHSFPRKVCVCVCEHLKETSQIPSMCW